MSILSKPHRRGGAAAGFFSFMAILLALLAVAWAMFKDPWRPDFTLRNPFGSPLSRYNMKSPGEAYKGLLEIQLNSDIPAMAELGRLQQNKLAKEKVESFEVKSDADFSRTEKVKEKDKEVKYKVLFATWKEDTKEVKEVVAMRWDDEAEMWRPSRLSPQEVAGKNADLAKQMEEWMKKN
jgi:hypothetical protein